MKAAKGEGVHIGGLIHNTKAGIDVDVKMKHLDRLVSQTTGNPREKPVMSGVLTRTVNGGPDVPELHKVAKGIVGKTQPKTMGQVPFQGPKY